MYVNWRGTNILIGRFADAIQEGFKLAWQRVQRGDIQSSSIADRKVKTNMNGKGSSLSWWDSVGQGKPGNEDGLID